MNTLCEMRSPDSRDALAIWPSVQPGRVGNWGCGVWGLGFLIQGLELGDKD
jgi:hypothetical protein